MAAAEKAAALVDHDSAEALLKRMEWTVLRRLDGILQGDHRTLMRGAGLDLADLREYQHHDDVRHIDWNVTARLQTPYVRQFTEDRELSAWFLVDLSASVDFGSDRFTKRTVAREFVAVLARLLTRHGNRVGALLYGSNVDTVLTVAVVDDLNHDGIYNDAPNVVTDANGDGQIDRRDLEALGVASNIVRVPFHISGDPA